MTRDLRIRAAAAGEWPDIARVLQQCGLPIEEVEPAVNQFHVAILDGQLVGCGGGERYGDTVVVTSVAVLPEFRDRGIASHLVWAVLTRARANGCRRAVLLSATCPSYFARYGFSLCAVENLPQEVLAAKAFRRRDGTPPLCMHCELK
jgi:amino-acid N-acetyltransferase